MCDITNSADIDSVNTIPDELWHMYIFKYLDIQSLGAVKQISRYMKRVVADYDGRTLDNESIPNIDTLAYVNQYYPQARLNMLLEDKCNQSNVHQVFAVLLEPSNVIQILSNKFNTLHIEHEELTEELAVSIDINVALHIYGSLYIKTLRGDFSRDRVCNPTELTLLECNNLSEVSNFDSLVELEISESYRLSKVESLPKLKRLKIERSSHMYAPVISHISDLPSLDSLILENVGINTIRDLPALSYLFITHQSTSTEIVNCPNIKKLCIHKYSINHPHLILPNLEYLTLTGSIINIDNLLRCDKLVDISLNAEYGNSIPSISKLPNLLNLTLMYIQISDIADLPSLHKLYIDHCDIQSVTNLPLLKKIGIYNSKVRYISLDNAADNIIDSLHVMNSNIYYIHFYRLTTVNIMVWSFNSDGDFDLSNIRVLKLYSQQDTYKCVTNGPECVYEFQSRLQLLRINTVSQYWNIVKQSVRLWLRL